MSDNNNPLNSFAATRLPWVVAAGALVLYLATLHSWISFASLPAVSHVGGWHYLPQTKQPLLYLVTLPLKLLPASALPFAMNGLAAVFGALTLALLVRSVALLPHDRTKEQRQREQSEHSLLSIGLNWMPPLFAALICGLQLSFWQHSTSGTGEILNLLLFAYVIRCLLEYRLDDKPSWLIRATVVFAISIPNNWGMIGFLPLFGVALLWTGRMRLFHEGLWLKLLFTGIAGLSLYLLLPLVAVMTGSGYSFTEVLTDNLGDQKSFLSNLFSNRLVVMVMACTSILPLLLLGIRWPVSFGDTNAAASAITTVLLRLVHFLFLVACVYTAFDHLFSPRKLVKAQQVVGVGAPFITFYYLGSLSAGYFLGYLLLLFGKDDARRWQKPTGFTKTLNRGAYGGLSVAALVVAALLAWQNIGAVWAHNKNDVTGIYTKWLSAKLPKVSAVLLSDGDMSPQRQLLKAELARSNRENTPLLVDTHRLASPRYHAHLAKLSPAWPALSDEVADSVRVDEFLILDKLHEVADKTPIIYTHPSFGYFFEQFHGQPENGLFRLAKYDLGGESLDKPRLASTAAGSETEQLASIKSTFSDLADEAGDLQQSNFQDTLIIMSWLSRNVNARGVELARSNCPSEAEAMYRAANELFKGSPGGNITAQANLRHLFEIQNNTNPEIEFTENLAEMLSEQNLLSISQINHTLKTYGPLDEPNACLLLGQFFESQSQIRQAYQEMVRATELTTTDPEPLLFVANMFVTYGMPDKTQPFIDKLRTMKQAKPFQIEQEMRLIKIETGVRLLQDDLETAEKYLNGQLQPHMDTLPGLRTLLGFYMDNELPEKALPILDLWIKENPNDIDAQVGRGLLLAQLKKFDDAISALETAFEDSSGSAKTNIRSQLAAVLVEKGEFDSALKHINDALDNDPESGKFLYQKATIFMQMKEHENAIPIFDDLLALNEWNHEVLANRAESFMATKQYANAKEDYEKLQSLTPNDPRMYLRFAQIAEAQNSAAEELKNYELFLKYLEQDSVPATELEQIQKRVEELRAAQGATP